MNINSERSLLAVRSFVQSHLSKGQSLHESISPTLLIDEQSLAQALARFQKHLPNVKLFYAAKANASAHILQYFAKQGIGVDVASPGEIEAALAAGFLPENMLLSTPVKTRDAIISFFDNKLMACCVDTVGECARLLSFFHQLDSAEKKPAVFIRLRVDSRDVEVNLNEKFGCSIAEALDIVEYMDANDGQVAGLCFHVGTQATSADNYHLGIQTALVVVHEAKRRFGVDIDTINIGGGFCDETTAADKGIELDILFRDIGQACSEATKHGMKLIAEPGRSLVASSGIALTSVIGTSTRGGERWVYLDDGIYGCFSVGLYEKHNFEFERLRIPHLASQQVASNSTPVSWVVAGPTCDSLDVVSRSTLLPSDLREGDILFTQGLGAYTLATANTFNGFKTPPCVMFRSNKVGNRERFSFSDSRISAKPRENLIGNAY
jgi:ornithine decarboxylase